MIVTHVGRDPARGRPAARRRPRGPPACRGPIPEAGWRSRTLLDGVGPARRRTGLPGSRIAAHAPLHVPRRRSHPTRPCRWRCRPAPRRARRGRRPRRPPGAGRSPRAARGPRAGAAAASRASCSAWAGTTRDHAQEMGGRVPEQPLIFSKLVSSVTGPGGPVPLPGYTEQLDYEAELAVVIGTRARDVAPEDALDHVFGYAVMDDVTARDLQRSEPQWVRAKGGDGFGPFGPVGHDRRRGARPAGPHGAQLGQRRAAPGRQHRRHDLPASRSSSRGARATSPSSRATSSPPARRRAWATARTPPVFLRPGDRVRVEVGGLGAIEHPIS